MNGGTNIALAIQTASKLFESEIPAGSTRTLIILTDGRIDHYQGINSRRHQGLEARVPSVLVWTGIQVKKQFRWQSIWLKSKAMYQSIPLGWAVGWTGDLSSPYANVTHTCVSARNVYTSSRCTDVSALVYCPVLQSVWNSKSVRWRLPYIASTCRCPQLGCSAAVCPVIAPAGFLAYQTVMDPFKGGHYTSCHLSQG